jgi:hypothetical protein
MDLLTMQAVVDSFSVALTREISVRSRADSSVAATLCHYMSDDR